MKPTTIREALRITKGNYLLPDGRNLNSGADFFVSHMDAPIGAAIGEYVTRWDSDNDVLELLWSDCEEPGNSVPQLEICRSDLGDGGWSLHAPAGDIVPNEIVLASGEGRMVFGQWAAPSRKAYAAAAAEYRRRAAEYRRRAQSGCRD